MTLVVLEVEADHGSDSTLGPDDVVFGDLLKALSGLRIADFVDKTWLAGAIVLELSVWVALLTFLSLIVLPKLHQSALTICDSRRVGYRAQDVVDQLLEHESKLGGKVVVDLGWHSEGYDTSVSIVVVATEEVIELRADALQDTRFEFERHEVGPSDVRFKSLMALENVVGGGRG